MQVIVPTDAISEEFATRYAAKTGVAPAPTKAKAAVVESKPAENKGKAPQADKADKPTGDDQSAKKKVGN